MVAHYEWKVGTALPELGAHSVAKHAIFEQYVGIYIDRLTRTPSQTMLNLTIVDGFCGGGLYRRQGAIVDGSPFRLLGAVKAAERALDDARTKGFHVRADYFFVDENAEHVAFLKDALIKRGYGGRLEQDIFLRCDAFETACPDILAHIRRKGTAQRALFFLDQYGWSDVRLATIRTMLATLANPEVLLTFAVDALIDFLSLKSADSQALLNIDMMREDVRALVEMKSGEGWRYLIQNCLYRHIQTRTGARFYTPFFIHSVEAHRSYWLLHLSNHRQARDEMGKLHWRLNNHFHHHGGAGFHALGFDPSHDLRQGLLPFMFDDDALRRSETTVIEQLPALIRSASQGQQDILIETLFAGHCNDTPVTSDILARQLLLLRDEGEVQVVGTNGSAKPRARNLHWGDRIVLPPQRSMFSRLGF